MVRSLHAAVEAATARATAEELLWAIWSGSGLDRHWGDMARGTGRLAEEANRHLDAVVALFAAAKRFGERDPEATAAGFLTAWLGAEIEQDTLARGGRTEAVFVGTSAALVGEEFDVVFVTDLQEGLWPNPRVRGSLLGTAELVERFGGGASIDRGREVLHDELRLLAAAIAHARREVVALAIGGEEQAVSPFLRAFGEPSVLDLLDEETTAPLTLRGIVGRARRSLTASGDPTAAATLARLAESRVVGADPGEWYGLADLTTSAPLVDDGAAVRVRPSSVATWQECELHWALRQLGGDRHSSEASLGTIVHDVANEIANGAPYDVDAIDGAIGARWAELEFESPWLEERERTRASAIRRGARDV